MTPAERFFKYFNAAYRPEESVESSTLSNEFVEEFIAYIPDFIDELETNLLKHEIGDFYVKIKNLKYLCEYSEEFNRCWLLLRAISGGLKRLLDEPTLNHATEVYVYYYSKYGGRRRLRDENWFEHHRWDFLDKLAVLKSDDELNEFILERIEGLSSYFYLYRKELESFINDLKRLAS
ncbi:MAG TPA: hypothetical protein VKA27_14315 [Sunxiuqinia sp.]|nr:hypothetical protein [Sunxiuqinia sp.]